MQATEAEIRAATDSDALVITTGEFPTVLILKQDGDRSGITFHKANRRGFHAVFFAFPWMTSMLKGDS